jgi:hypothetical protein
MVDNGASKPQMSVDILTDNDEEHVMQFFVYLFICLGLQQDLWTRVVHQLVETIGLRRALFQLKAK